MHIVFSLLYAPFVVYLFKHFDIQIVSLSVFSISLVWLIIILKKNAPLQTLLFPIFYMIFSSFCFFLEDFIVLKVLPLSLSILVGFYFIYDIYTKNSLVLHFAKRFKKDITPKEEEYIQSSTYLWASASFLNIFIHIYVLLDDNINYWIIYSSFGWYFVFLITFIIQIIHKKLFFKGKI